MNETGTVSATEKFPFYSGEAGHKQINTQCSDKYYKENAVEEFRDLKQEK